MRSCLRGDKLSDRVSTQVDSVALKHEIDARTLRSQDAKLSCKRSNLLEFGVAFEVVDC